MKKARVKKMISSKDVSFIPGFHTRLRALKMSNKTPVISPDTNIAIKEAKSRVVFTIISSNII